jgi:hypothetical protein
MKPQHFPTLALSAVVITLAFAGAGSLPGTALAEETAQPTAPAPATAAPAVQPPATGSAASEATAPVAAPPAESEENKAAGPRSSSLSSYYRNRDDRFRERMEAQREARQQALEQYRSARRWWNNPYAEQRRLWNKSRSEWYQQQAEQRREYLEQQRPAYSYEYERPGYDYEYSYGPGYYYGRNDTTPGRWNDVPFGGWGPGY